jgi:hypothetical protein
MSNGPRRPIGAIPKPGSRSAARGRQALLRGVLMIALLVGGARAADLQTPISASQIDAAAYKEWVDGAERPVSDQANEGARWVLCTRDSKPGYTGQVFGKSKNAGVRHLRIGFTTAIPVGTVFIKGDAVSVLKPGAAYPGDLGDDRQWIPAQPAPAWSGNNRELSTWVLPPGTTTRALRFTHVSKPADKDYHGWMAGAFVLAERYENIATQAEASASDHPELVAKLTNLLGDEWLSWDNAEHGAKDVVSPEHPVWVMLTWSEPQTIAGLNAYWAGFTEAEAQAYAGPADRHPGEAGEADWKTIKAFTGIDHQYPGLFGVNWLDFGQPVTTRAVRLKITKPIDDQHCHDHIKGRANGGRRVWLGELLAMRPLGKEPLSVPGASAKRALAARSHPPIPVTFSLKNAGVVTLVIEDATGRRVRNLVAETPFPAGENTVWWDGLDDVERDEESASHGVYHIPGKLVAPGTYTVRGLVRDQLELKYEMSVYTNGHPAWATADGSGEWLANHTPPAATLFIPAEDSPYKQPTMLLGSYVTEGGSGLAWTDLDGRKLGGVGWLGGNWTGAPYLARDAGEHAVKAYYAYAGSAWDGELRLTGLKRGGGDQAVLKWKFPGGKAEGGINGLAVRDGTMVCSLPLAKSLLFVDVAAGRVLGSVPCEDPRGLAFDARGRLLAVLGAKVVRYQFPADLSLRLAGAGAKGAPPALVPQPFIEQGLEDPQQLTIDADGTLYISDRGVSHQVKVFSAEGKALRAIGTAGAPRAGAYDRTRMTNPRGVAISVDPASQQRRLWVAEDDYQPKRVSVWSLDGVLAKDFYGPGSYGGGGKLDPRDKTRFYYYGMEFRLDWDKNTSELVSVFHRPDGTRADLAADSLCGHPEDPVYVEGRQYLTNTYNSNPTNGAHKVGIWLLEKNVARLVAVVGSARDWPDAAALIKTRLPAGADLQRDPLLAVWSDANGDGQIQGEELSLAKQEVGGVVVMPDLTVVTNHTTVLKPKGFAPGGAPLYDVAGAPVLVPGARLASTSGGGQALIGKDGWTVMTVPPAPYPQQSSMAGAKDGKPLWTYPSLWPGLHPSHTAPVPDRPGELIGTTRLLGGFVTPKGSDIGELWAITGNQGCFYLFSSDGLFIAQLFQDVRVGKSWAMPVATRGMVLNEVSLHDENFWPGLTQTADGAIYAVDGARTSLVRIDGLESIRRLPPQPLALSAEQLAAAREALLKSEAERQSLHGRTTLAVALRERPPVVDGKLDDWADADWAMIDSRRQQTGDWSSKEDRITGAVAVSGDRLYAAWHTGDPDLLRNSGETWQTLFKHGGCLDLMIGTDASADPGRSQPVAGDQRLLVTLVKGKPLAVRYRPVVPGTAPDARVPFTSPVSTINMDKVEQVDDVQLARSGGDFELSVPLALLGLKPKPGLIIKADIGLLRGDGAHTTQRVYWSNKATGITADVPSEAMLTPQLWGRWAFK